MLKYEVKANFGKARAGIFNTQHGIIKTPIFMPIATRAVVRSMPSEELVRCNVQMILGNTYHLYLKPGLEVIKKMGGLHHFMNWNESILTDSGGFQVFSLSKFGIIEKEGYYFKSHIDGSKHMFSPEKAIYIQFNLNSDIMMCLDQCIKYPSSFEDTKKALIVTNDWAKRCKNFWKNECGLNNDLFGIIQGGMFKSLRAKAVKELISIGFSGYALGGLCVGESRKIMIDMASYVLSLLPKNVPRYIMGVGRPEDIVDLISAGADMFDCVVPTRNGRNGQLFTKNGYINIINACYKYDKNPVDLSCGCYTCRKYSKAYLRHLYISKETLAYYLGSIHNVHYYLSLISNARKAILSNNFDIFVKDFYNMRKNSIGV